MRRTAAALAVIGSTVVLGACETSSWSEKCSTDLDQRSCDIKVSGTRFHELPFPIGGPVMSSTPDRFRLEEATEGGSARFSAGSSEGGTFTCTVGQTVQAADSTITCTEIGDTRLHLTVTRVR